MKERTLKTKLLTVLLTLCMVLSIVPITAFAAEIDFLPQGVTYLNDLKHTYHKQVNVTANVSVKDSNGAVVETKQVTKSSEEFMEGGVGALQAKLAALQAEIETPYQASGTVTRGPVSAQTIVDHFETASFYTFTPASGDPVKFSTDLDAAKQYFSEHPDATGTFTKLLDMHKYLKHNYTYDLNVQENSQPTNTITAATIENAKFDYQLGDAPQASAWVAVDDMDKYEIAYECWQQFENNEPVAAWYSDNGSHGSLPTITEFESGKHYVYFLMLKPKDGYSFNSETTVTVNGESVKSSLSGEYLYIPAVKTITPTKQNSTLTAVDVENVKLDYQLGNAPQASAKKAGTNQDKYDILFECWEKQEKDANDTMNTVGYWYSDESCYSDGDVRFSTFEKGGRYGYSVKLQAKDGYTFDSNLTNTENVTLNGASLPFGSWVMVMDDGKTCLIQYGTELRPGQAVEKIDFNARINFNAGDKPLFSTGVIDPIVDTDHQRWDANDGSGYGITSSDYWNERYNGKLITEFEAGKSYTYGVYFKISDLGMEEGYRFDKNTKLYINGEEITLTPDQINVDDNGETIWFSNVLTMTPTTVKVIDVVEINGVTVSFKDGDKPVFTGKSPEGVKYAYNCEWWELDSKTGAISADFFSGAYENKITAFEAGKTYHYGVYVKAVGYVESENTTYLFGSNTKLKINGEFVNYTRYEGDESDGSDGTMWVLTDLTMTPEAGGTTPAEKYTVTYTDGVDGEEIFKDQTYTVEAGKATPAFNGTPTRKGYTFVGWKPAVAATVTGNATYEATWKSNTTTTTPSDNKPNTGETTSPKTGDTSNMLLWFALLFVSGAGVIGATVYSKKKRVR
ncbi:MAG: hypothetical protein DBY08_00645 [Clostridiales bacterium]|nr:MAG: hypothetical protein DBY08_00645 [Clostridiales bacterium]